MSARLTTGRVLAAIGLAGAGAAVAGVAHHHRRISRREGSVERLGSLRGEVSTVVAEDGVALHVEVDEPDDPAELEGGVGPTVVLVHGYALQQDCWHYQRAHLRGRHRLVLFDQRSHGRSQRSDKEHATIDQLGRDLRDVLRHVAPEEQVVLLGHSMGGMSIMAYAEQHPEEFADRVLGVGLVSTTAGGLVPSRLVAPYLPRRLSAPVAERGIRVLARGPKLVDLLRRAGTDLGRVLIDLFAFGSEVPAATIDFVDGMINDTEFEVIAAFFPSFGTLDKFRVLTAFAQVPTWIVCGTADKMTSVGHSRKMAQTMPWAHLVEVEGAGHMVLLESPGQVNRAIDDLLDAVAASGSAARHQERA